MSRKRIEQDEPQDTEGNARYSLSDAEIKHDVTPLAEAEGETQDTEGHGRKLNIEQGLPESEDTEGNGSKLR